MSKVRDDWFITAHGRRLFILEPDPAHIHIDDIAHALSNLCRFGGHVPFYSIAQHSVLVSRIVPQQFALAGLLHDASEAYLGDVIRPLKRQLFVYRDIERQWEDVIARRFRLGGSMPHTCSAEVKLADLVALATERRDLLPFADPKQAPTAWEWVEDELAVEPHPDRIVPLSPSDARTRFLARFEELTDP